MAPGDAANFELELYTPPSGGDADFEFAREKKPPFLIGFEVLGQLGKANAEDPLDVFGIYQRRHTRKGRKVGRMAFYPYVITHTGPQEANRAKFAAAQAAWMALTADEKSVYTKRAKKRGMFGWGLFIREYYQLV